MNKKDRTRKLLLALNQYMDSFSYYDDELDETVIDGDESECYNTIMQDYELHLLKTEVVKNIIHICFTDWEKFNKICLEYKAY